MVATRRSLRSGDSEPLFEPDTLETKPEHHAKPLSRGKSASAPSSRARTRSLSPRKKANGAPVVKADGQSDVHEEYEFNGPLGAGLFMLFSPLLLYYFWICLTFLDGHLAYPSSIADAPGWLRQMGKLIAVGARPTPPAIAIYLGLVAFQLLLALVLPGYQQEGLPISSLGGKRLMYNCNALGAWYITLVTVAALHFSGVVRLPILIDRFGEIMTVAQIFGFVVAGVCYVAAKSNGTAIRMSGNLVYDYFMGAALNPRIGSVDIKMWAEVRIPWILLFLFSLAGVAKQHDDYGYVSPNQWFMVLTTGLFINACAKGEELIPQTWDMAYEKFGWLLSYWNFAGVPFTYCYSIVYMATHNPATYRFPTWAYFLLYGTYLTAYFIWDTSMAQKSRFKMEHAGNYRPRKAFPQLPFSHIRNAKYLQTAKGKLLVDGWWAYLRKPNYSADMVQALTWALCAGFGSILPYWYPFFFFVGSSFSSEVIRDHLTDVQIMIVHRCGRDFARCARKYGKDWDEYCRIVPYRFIPGVY